MNLNDAHREWVSRKPDERFETLDSLIDAATDMNNASYDEQHTLGDLIVRANNGDLVVESQGRQARMTNWSFGQLSRLVGAPAKYLTELPGYLAADNLNYGLGRYDEVKTKILWHDRGKGVTARAFTGPDYGRIMAEPVLRRLKSIVDNSNFYNPKDYTGTPSGLYLGDRDFFAFMIDGGSWVDGGGKRDQLQKGFFVKGSEVGASSQKYTRFFHRGVCGNHIVWSVEKVKKTNIRHTKLAPDRWEEIMDLFIFDFVNEDNDEIHCKIVAAKQHELPKENAKGYDVLDWLQSRGLTVNDSKEVVRIAKEEEGQCETVWDAIQGITSFAKRFPFIDQRVELETVAGNILRAA